MCKLVTAISLAGMLAVATPSVAAEVVANAPVSPTLSVDTGQTQAQILQVRRYGYYPRYYTYQPYTTFRPYYNYRPYYSYRPYAYNYYYTPAPVPYGYYGYYYPYRYGYGYGSRVYGF